METHSRHMFPPGRPLEAVIAHTPIIQPPGCTPGYILLRETKGQYIVHNVEVDERGAFVGCYWGHYFDKDQSDALKHAMERFVEKTVKWHHIPLAD